MKKDIWILIVVLTVYIAGAATIGEAINIIMVIIVIALVWRSEKKTPLSDELVDISVQEIQSESSNSAPIGSTERLIIQNSPSMVQRGEKAIVIDHIREKYKSSLCTDEGNYLPELVKTDLQKAKNKQELMDLDVFSEEMNELDFMISRIVAFSAEIKNKTEQFVNTTDIRFSTVNRLEEKMKEQLQPATGALKQIHNALIGLDKQLDLILESHDKFLVGQIYEEESTVDAEIAVSNIKKNIGDIQKTVSEISHMVQDTFNK